MSIKYSVSLVNGERYELDKEEDVVKLRNGFLCFYTEVGKGKIIPGDKIVEITFTDSEGDEEAEEYLNDEEESNNEVKPKRKSLFGNLFGGKTE